MPLGFERINERTQRPNSLINFIKPLPGRTSAYAQDFLERIAAICHPIMKANHIAVMALEEYEPNPEFIGRNFNAGEVIQLVLKDRRGGWLPFRSVQMVMMHELAHCKQMNHSGAFWKVRNQYAGELRELWGKGYTGDGFWGRGKTTLSQEYETNDGPPPELEPASLCGGTFRSRGRKRTRGAKEKPTISYAERKQRRILKKFGAGGTALGDDETKRLDLEGGKPAKGKPRVAGSARGRELRAAAALARFEKVKPEPVKEEVRIKKEESDSESGSDYEEDPTEAGALDIDGTAMTDQKGHGLVKVCEGEDGDDENAKSELAELYNLDGNLAMRRKPKLSKASDSAIKGQDPMASKGRTTGVIKPLKPDKLPRGATASDTKPSSTSGLPTQAPIRARAAVECPVCSLENEAPSLTCVACANVLNTSLLPNHWRCASAQCAGGAYINAGDTGLCGVCGATKPPGD